jgi:predicted  nucleic acid-binding Zn-ribbon protein
MGSDALVNMGFGRTVKNHRHFGVYAVSQEDAKRVTEGLLELWTTEARRGTQEAEDSFRKQQEDMARANNDLKNKQVELDNVTRQLEELRASARSLPADQDAREQAKATVLEMDNILNMLDIEITGIKARLTAIDQYKSEKKLTSIEGLAKLEVMLAEQTVELAGALAKMEAARGIRGAHQRLYELATQRASLKREVRSLRTDLGKWPARRREWEERLADPPAFWLQPKVYENKVRIYPVRVEQ